MAEERIPNSTGTIAYLDYVALFCFMDAEWTMGRQGNRLAKRSDVFRHNHVSFFKHCANYRREIEANYRQLCEANKTKCQDPMEPWLFDPVFWYPFGHSDDLAIVLLDDLDPVQYLTGAERIVFEEVCLAFCPELASLWTEPETRPHFVELHNLFHSKRSVASEDVRKAYGGADRECQQTTPLLAFTRYKMEGLGVTGQSLLCQNAFLRAVIQKTEQVLAVLRQRLDSDPDVGGLMSKEDIDSVRIALLDLQGPEELGTLIVSSNLSVSLSVIGAIRSMTWKEVFAADITGELRAALTASRIPRELARLSRELTGSPISNSIEEFRHNHAVRWCQTSLAVAPEAFYRRNHSKCNGFVEAWSSIRTAPGHQLEVQRVIEAKSTNAAYARRHRRAAQDGSLGHARDRREYLPPKSSYTRYQIGDEDLTFCYSSGDGSESWPPLVPLKHVMGTVKDLTLQFGPFIDGPRPRRDVVDLFTSVTVPVPRLHVDLGGETTDLISGEVVKPHFAPFVSLLPALRDRLFFPYPCSGLGKNGRRPALLSFERLKSIPREYGLPVALHRTILYLYQDYATVLADPFLFDVALDFYDTFATLHALLTRHLPEARRRERGAKEGEWLGYLDDGRVAQLSQMLEAIHNAFTHRMVRALPEPQVRDMAIDFRGGLTQVLSAADATVKCGLGLLRRWARPSADDSDHLDSVGVVTRIGFAPGASCCSLRMGKKDAVTLAFFAVDVPHVLNISSYCDHLHETFHLTWDAVSQGAPQFAPSLIASPMRRRAEEIFAGLMSEMLLCRGRDKVFLCYQACSHSKSQSSAGEDPADSVIQIAELLIRGFMAHDAIPDADPSTWAGISWIREKEAFPKVLKRFEQTVEEIGPLFTEYASLEEAGHRDTVHNYIIGAFKEQYEQIATLMPFIWSKAAEIFDRYWQSCILLPDGTPRYDLRKLESHVVRCFKTGQPVIRSLQELWRPENSFDQHKQESDPGVDPLLIISQVLREYISPARINGKQQIHLQRNPETRDIEYKGRNGWRLFQIEKGAASMYSPVPTERRRRLRRQVVVFKTLWDISSSLRARRLLSMIDDNWAPEETPVTISPGVLK